MFVPVICPSGPNFGGGNGECWKSAGPTFNIDSAFSALVGVGVLSRSMGRVGVLVCSLTRELRLCSDCGLDV